ncbi:MAG: hypothetical protein M1820_003643 [Bogoriella megaspora]|nr:MAG: hypothetical protein M1820_003643 [Bogoriella megaspora]
MPTLAQRAENFLAQLLSSQRGRDRKLFLKSAVFAGHPDPNILVISPELGESGAAMTIDHSPFGANACPELSWTVQESSQPPVEYVVVVEDPDAPLPSLVVHGIYYSIPSTKRTLTRADLQLDDDSAATTKGGFRYGLNRMKSVVALNDKIQGKDAGSPKMTKEELQERVAGKIVGWGEWIGTFERKLE